MYSEQILNDWAALHDLPKEIFGYPDWRNLTPVRASGKIRSTLSK